RPEDALGRTQLGDMPGKLSAAVQTDLSTTRDTTAPPDTTPKRSPMLYALPVVAVLGIGGVAAAFVATQGSKTSGAGTDSTTSAVSSAPSAATTPPSPSTTPTVSSVPAVAS